MKNKQWSYDKEMRGLRALMYGVECNFNETIDEAALDAIIYERRSIVERQNALIRAAKKERDEAASLSLGNVI